MVFGLHMSDAQHSHCRGGKSTLSMAHLGHSAILYSGCFFNVVKQTVSSQLDKITAATIINGDINPTPSGKVNLDFAVQEQEVLNAVELSIILRIHPVTVRLKAAAGLIPGRQIGNRWRFSRTRINEWLMAA